DGGLQVVDYLSEVLEDVHPSYFASFTCTAWSPDAKYLVAGGKDDLVTVWSSSPSSSSSDHALIAHCMGHESWVRTIAFDPVGQEDTYRFMSMGNDKLLVWDFPACPPPPTCPLCPIDGACLEGAPGAGDDSPLELMHPRLPRAAVTVLQPLVAVAIHDLPIFSLQFSQDLLITACHHGMIRVQKRLTACDLSSYI
ncbi:hypothetical protein H4S07_003400, partial [Coemansia furcata]